MSRKFRAVEVLARDTHGVPRLLNQAGHRALTLACEVGANRHATENKYSGVELLWPKDEVFMLQGSRTADASRRRPTRDPARR